MRNIKCLPELSALMLTVKMNFEQKLTFQKSLKIKIKSLVQLYIVYTNNFIVLSTGTINLHVHIL